MAWAGAVKICFVPILLPGLTGLNTTTLGGAVSSALGSPHAIAPPTCKLKNRRDFIAMSEQNLIKAWCSTDISGSAPPPPLVRILPINSCRGSQNICCDEHKCYHVRRPTMCGISFDAVHSPTSPKKLRARGETMPSACVALSPAKLRRTATVETRSKVGRASPRL